MFTFIRTLRALRHKPVSRDQIVRLPRGLCSADYEQDRQQPYPVDPYSAIRDDYTYILRTLVMQVLVSRKWSPSHVAVAATCLSCSFAPTVVPKTPRCRRRVLRYLSNSMEAAPPLHERAMEPKNILRQLSIRKKDCREGGRGAGEFGPLNLPTTCRFLVASVVQARRPAFATS